MSLNTGYIASFAKERAQLLTGTNPVDLANIRGGRDLEAHRDLRVNERAWPAARALVQAGRFTEKLCLASRTNRLTAR